MDTDATFQLEQCPPAEFLPWQLQKCAPVLRRLIKKYSIPAGAGLFDFSDVEEDEVVLHFLTVLNEYLPPGVRVAAPPPRAYQLASSTPSAGSRTPSSTGAYFSMENNPMYGSTPRQVPPCRTPLRPPSESVAAVQTCSTLPFGRVLGFHCRRIAQP